MALYAARHIPVLILISDHIPAATAGALLDVFVFGYILLKVGPMPQHLKIDCMASKYGRQGLMQEIATHVLPVQHCTIELFCTAAAWKLAVCWQYCALHHAVLLAMHAAYDLCSPGLTPGCWIAV